MLYISKGYSEFLQYMDSVKLCCLFSYVFSSYKTLIIRLIMKAQSLQSCRLSTLSSPLWDQVRHALITKLDIILFRGALMTSKKCWPHELCCERFAINYSIFVNQTLFQEEFCLSGDYHLFMCIRKVSLARNIRQDIRIISWRNFNLQKGLGAVKLHSIGGDFERYDPT